MVNYAAPKIEKANFSPVLYVFEVKESISDIFTELPWSRDLEILGQLPVLLPIFALIADTVALVANLFLLFPHFLCSRGRGIRFSQFHKATDDLENPGQLPVSQVLEGTDD